MTVSADSTRIFYSADPGTLRELYSAPIDASAPPVRINPPLVLGGEVEERFVLTLDETRVVYAADQELNNRLEVYIAPVDGSGASLKLSAPVLPGVPRADPTYWNVVVSESHAVFAGHLGSQSRLLCVPLDGSAAPVEVASFPRTDTAFAGFGRERIVFSVHDGVARKLYSAPLDGAPPSVELNLPLPPGGSVSSVVLDPRGEYALYHADQEIDGFLELYWVPLDGSSPARKVNRPGVSVDYGFALTRDGMSALYVGVPDEGMPGVFLDTLRTRPGVATQ